jgi:hypothetical protein
MPKVKGDKGEGQDDTKNEEDDGIGDENDGGAVEDGSDIPILGTAWCTTYVWPSYL